MPDYDIHTDVKYPQATKLDVAAIAAAQKPWWNQSLNLVNDAVIRLGVLDGEFHWHHHDEEDEFFFVLEGTLLIDLEGADTITLAPHQGYTVPRKVVHRTRAPGRVVVLMVEKASVVPTGD